MLLVSNVSGTATKFKKLYQWLDSNAISLGKFLTDRHYGRVSTLTGAQVTSSGFVTRVRVLAKASGSDALDVFLNVHGSARSLRFANGWTKMSTVRDQLGDLDLGHRFRLLYSTACYGAEHAPEFVAAGFRTASGAVGVNTNGPYDFPTQLTKWVRGDTYQDAVRAANNRVMLTFHDRLARHAGFSNVDSKKLIFGTKQLRITSQAG